LAGAEGLRNGFEAVEVELTRKGFEAAGLGKVIGAAVVVGFRAGTCGSTLAGSTLAGS
jgi:hypothetical protein